MKAKNKPEPKVKLTVYVPPAVREKIESYGTRTFRDLSKTVQYLLETHPELNEPTRIAQIEQK